jgi:hypothetical protein
VQEKPDTAAFAERRVNLLLYNQMYIFSAFPGGKFVRACLNSEWQQPRALFVLTSAETGSFLLAFLRYLATLQ